MHEISDRVVYHGHIGTVVRINEAKLTIRFDGDEGVEAGAERVILDLAVRKADSADEISFAR